MNRFIDDAYRANFNPRPPWGGRLGDYRSEARTMQFQSTPSVGRATLLPRRSLMKHRLNFNPRPPWGGRLIQIWHICRFKKYFNPRPPWGGRPIISAVKILGKEFQSTPSVGRATCGARLKNPFPKSFQSTPSVGRATSPSPIAKQHQINFNPRPPWGGRQSVQINGGNQKYFNPRPPWGGRLQNCTISERTYLQIQCSFD